MGKTHYYGMSRGSRPSGGKNKSNNSVRANNSYNGASRGGAGRGGSSHGSVHAIPLGKPKAPYNFVPLNDVVLKAPFIATENEAEAQKQYKSFLTNGEEKYSGYFVVSLQNLTPLFINNGKDKFFSDGENYLIPGSSLRGMVKNYFKIITNGTMRTGDDGDVTDKYLYYRTFASPFRPSSEAYKREMTTNKVVNNKPMLVPKTLGGFLVREGKEYFICPATFKRIKDETLAQRKTSTIEWNNTYVDVFTGPMRGKKHYYEFTGAQWQKKLEIPEEILLSYYADKNGNKTNKQFRLFDEYGKLNKSLWKPGSDKAKILQGAERYDYVVPCFYVADGNVVRHFGSGPLYRIPYKKSIGEHIPVKLNNSIVDFTAALFGNKDSWASRVFFENLYLQSGETAHFDAKNRAQALLSANPTSFQNYLETQNGQAAYWNADTKIRGYKLYWHKKCDWRKKSSDRNQNTNVTKEVAPLLPNHTFIGKVRFENLSLTELGALAQVLSLGDNSKSAYKLGMGKSIGLGSVRIKTDLYLQTTDYYTSLFSAKGFDSGIEQQDKEDYIAAFKQYMQQSLTPTSLQLYKERMQELEIIMDESYLNQADWPDKTAYMDINNREDKDLANHRIPLPSIKEVVKK